MHSAASFISWHETQFQLIFFHFVKQMYSTQHNTVSWCVKIIVSHVHICFHLCLVAHYRKWFELCLYLNYLHLINDDICCRTAPAACSTHSNYQECKLISNLASDSSGRPESWKFQLLHWKWRKMQKIGLGTKFQVTILVVISPSQL